MLKKSLMLILAALIFTHSAVGCGNTNTIQPEKAVQDFADSVGFDTETGTISFTIPQGLNPKYSFSIHVSGRVKMGDGGMSVHPFEDESESDSWEPGKTYRYEFGKGALLEGLIVVGIKERGKPELLCETQIDIDPGEDADTNQPDMPGQIRQISITFPANNDDGETEYNAHIYEIEPFELSLTIPDGWHMERWPLAGGYGFITAFSKLNFFNEKKECVGVIGYNIYEPYEGAEDDPRAIYNQIALGNNYHFDVRDSYNVVNETESGATAVADVYYAANINDGVEKNNRGIVSYNRDFLVYIAAEFNADKITDEQLMSIAKSIILTRNDSPANKESSNSESSYEEEIPSLTVTVEGTSVLLADMTDPLVRDFFSGCEGYDVDTLDIVVESMETRQKIPGHIDPRYTFPIYSLDTDGHDADYYIKLAEKLLKGEKMAGHIVQGMLSSPQWQGILFDDAGLPISIAIWGDDMQGNTAPVIDEMNRYEESERIDAFVRYFGGYILIMDDEIRNQLENHGFDLSKTDVKAGWFGYPGFFFTDGNNELIRVTGDTKTGYYSSGSYITPQEFAEDAIKFAADEKVRREAEPPLAPGENPPTG